LTASQEKSDIFNNEQIEHALLLSEEMELFKKLTELTANFKNGKCSNCDRQAWYDTLDKLKELDYKRKFGDKNE